MTDGPTSPLETSRDVIVPEKSGGITTVAYEPNPDGSDPSPPLPDVYRGALDAAGVRALFSDISGLSGPAEVRLKAAAEAYAEVGPVTSDRACELLLAGLVRGVQLIYEHDGQTWFDTVLRRGAAFEVVRMAR
ncbi:MAG: hypothetical protein KC502_20180 [Myxococcales bacterium]|nr:hypothetical protein [Myxococcales bacterium]